MMVLLPIILLGLIIIVAGLIITKGIGKYNSLKRTYWIVGSYLCLLLLSFFLYLATPTLQGQVKTEKKATAPDLDKIIYEGEPVDIASNYKVKQWEFDYNDDEIDIHYNGDDQNSVPVRLDRKGNDNKIEAVYYQTPRYYNGINLTSYMNPLSMNISADELVIELPETVYLNFTSFKKEFPFKQLTNEGFWENDDWFENVHETFGNQFLYLRIPENIKVNADSSLDIYDEGIME